MFTGIVEETGVVRAIKLSARSIALTVEARLIADLPKLKAAVATPAGRGGIGIVRVSGPAVPAVAQAVLGALPQARRATHCDFLDARGARLDEGEHLVALREPVADFSF